MRSNMLWNAKVLYRPKKSISHSFISMMPFNGISSYMDLPELGNLQWLFFYVFYGEFLYGIEPSSLLKSNVILNLLYI